MVRLSSSTKIDYKRQSILMQTSNEMRRINIFTSQNLNIYKLFINIEINNTKIQIDVPASVT